MENTKTISVFNTELQKETPHAITFSSTGEIVLTCEETGRFLKYAKGTTAEELKGLLAKHKEANEGQVTTEALDKQKDELLKGLLGEEEPKEE